MPSDERRVLAIDFDHTICDTAAPRDSYHRYPPPLPGAREAISRLREKGYCILIHSCNAPKWIEEWMRHHDIRYDYIWGESPRDCGQKPVAHRYIDDRAMRFDSWKQVLEDLDAT